MIQQKMKRMVLEKLLVVIVTETLVKLSKASLIQVEVQKTDFFLMNLQMMMERMV